MAAPLRIRAERTVGDAIATVPEIDTNTTADDAIARLSLARVGSLVTPTGGPLTAASLPYLRTLRNATFLFSEEIEKEIARVERRQLQEVSRGLL